MSKSDKADNSGNSISYITQVVFKANAYGAAIQVTTKLNLALLLKVRRAKQEALTDRNSLVLGISSDALGKLLVRYEGIEEESTGIGSNCDCSGASFDTDPLDDN